MNKHDVQFSMLPPAWGGPFVWIRNAKGNLVLHKISALTDGLKQVVETLEKKAIR